MTDFRNGLRILWKSPGFAAVAALTLALGIGATTAMFSIVDITLLRPLRYEDPDRLLLLWEKSAQGNLNVVAAQNFADWRDQNKSFEEMSAIWWNGFDLRGEPPVHLAGAKVSPNFFHLMRVRPELGRTFTPDDGQPGQPPVVVLSDRIWRNRFASDRQIAGKRITLNGEQYTVIGVAPAEFAFLDSGVDVWAPLTFSSWNFNRRVRLLSVVGRLRPGVTLEQAQGDLDAIARNIARDFPQTNKDRNIAIQRIRDHLLGQNVRYMVLVLFGAGGFVLLIACANIANLLLARGAARRTEIAVRIALGAARRRILRQLLVENVPVALLGGAGGLVIAAWTVSYLRSLDLMSAPGSAPIEITGTVVAVTFALSMTTTVLFGLVPALQVSKVNPYDAVKTAGGMTPGLRHGRLRDALVIGELALSLALLVGAGLLLQGFLRLRHVNPGFDTRNLLTAQLVVPVSHVPTEQVPAFYGRVLENVRGLPGVHSADAVSRLPLSGYELGRHFLVEGRDPSSRDSGADGNFQFITPGYFRTMSIPLVRGREFTAADDQQSVPVVIVNQTLATRFFPNEDAIGKRLVMPALIPGRSDQPPVLREIVGVCASVKVSGLDNESMPETYVPLAQNPSNSEYLVVRSSSDPATLTAGVRRAVSSLDRDLPLGTVETMEERVRSSLAGLRFNLDMLGVIAAMALLLASVGIYGVVSYSLAQRTHEIGIRMALGAHKRDVLRLVLLHAGRIVAWGLGTGLVFSFALIRILAAALFGVALSEPWPFVAVALLVGAVALLASCIPARRATRVDPMVALRYE